MKEVPIFDVSTFLFHLITLLPESGMMFICEVTLDT